MPTRSSVLQRYAWLAVLAAALEVTTFPARGALRQGSGQALRQSSGQADKRIVLLAGRPSHAPGDHEFRAGSLLLKKALTGFPLPAARATIPSRRVVHYTRHSFLSCFRLHYA